MFTEEDKKYLSYNINYDRDIEPYQFIKIFSGVGSGKNVFVDNLVKGDYFKHDNGLEVGSKSVLLISSRKAKIDEVLNNDTVTYDPLINVFDNLGGSWLVFSDPKYDDYYESPTKMLKSAWGHTKIYVRNCVNTNAKIEWNLRRNFTRTDKATHPWERFDIIVVDEVHSLISDASYQSAPFYVRRLIEETLKNSKKCKVILLTGTPESLNYDKLYEKAHGIDLREICGKVQPQKIKFITKNESTLLREEYLSNNERFIAFFNRINDINKFALAHEDKCVVSFSNKDELAELDKYHKSMYTKMKNTHNYLSENEMLPEDVIGFCSTSKNKEGINIKNEDIKAVFVETHEGEEIIQMTGRVRHPVEWLYVVVDSFNNCTKESELEDEIGKSADILDGLNNYFNKKCEELGVNIDDDDEFSVPPHMNPELLKIIDFINEKFPSIKYDYFTNKFMHYPEHRLSIEYKKALIEKFNNANESDEGLIALAKSWYPDVECYVSDKVKGLMYYANKEKLENYLAANHYLDGEFKNNNEKSKLLSDLIELLNIENDKKSVKLKSLLKNYGYDIEDKTKSKNGSSPFRVIKKVINDE